jgi:8-oxo-dGTP diphosphatase
MAVRALARGCAGVEGSQEEKVSGGVLVRVAAAVLLRRDGKVLLAQRLPGKPYPGYWEFPGGKLEGSESARDALVRELAEELGIEVTRAAPWLTQRFVYPHAHVELNFFRVFAWGGEPHGRDGQAITWQTPGAFDVEPLLPANAPVLRALELPAIYGITMAEDVGENVFVEQARVAMDRGLRLVQLREKSFSGERLSRFSVRLRDLAQARAARVLLNGDAETARALGCDGVHWTAARLLAAHSRPRDILCAASCHDRMDLARAAALGLDFVVLGPVKATPSHPAMQPLGWEGFAGLARASPLPIYALGGLTSGDVDNAIDHGAHGVALRRGAWVQ